MSDKSLEIPSNQININETIIVDNYYEDEFISFNGDQTIHHIQSSDIQPNIDEQSMLPSMEYYSIMNTSFSNPTNDHEANNDQSSNVDHHDHHPEQSELNQSEQANPHQQSSSMLIDLSSQQSNNTTNEIPTLIRFNSTSFIDEGNQTTNDNDNREIMSTVARFWPNTDISMIREQQQQQHQPQQRQQQQNRSQSIESNDNPNLIGIINDDYDDHNNNNNNNDNNDLDGFKSDSGIQTLTKTSISSSECMSALRQSIYSIVETFDTNLIASTKLNPIQESMIKSDDDENDEKSNDLIRFDVLKSTGKNDGPNQSNDHEPNESNDEQIVEKLIDVTMINNDSPSNDQSFNPKDYSEEMNLLDLSISQLESMTSTKVSISYDSSVKMIESLNINDDRIDSDNTSQTLEKSLIINDHELNISTIVTDESSSINNTSNSVIENKSIEPIDTNDDDNCPMINDQKESIKIDSMNKSKVSIMATNTNDQDRLSSAIDNDTRQSLSLFSTTFDLTNISHNFLLSSSCLLSENDEDGDATNDTNNKTNKTDGHVNNIDSSLTTNNSSNRSSITQVDSNDVNRQNKVVSASKHENKENIANRSRNSSICSNNRNSINQTKQPPLRSIPIFVSSALKSNNQTSASKARTLNNQTSDLKARPSYNQTSALKAPPSTKSMTKSTPSKIPTASISAQKRPSNIQREPIRSKLPVLMTRTRSEPKKRY